MIVSVRETAIRTTHKKKVGEIMERYNYLDALESDIKNVIEWNEYNPHEYESRDDCECEWYDQMFCDDSITGNASGSYFCNAYKAETALAHNWDLIREMSEYECMDLNIKFFDPETIDVYIRCYLLGTALSNVLDEVEDTIKERN